MDDFYAAKLDLYSRVSDEISYLQSIDALPPVPAQGDTEKPLNKPMIKKKHRHEPER